jgi:hypothetical protein
MAKPKHLTKEQILLAMKHTKSNKAAASWLRVSYIHYKMWAKRYHEFEGGRTLFDVHKNQAGKGIRKLNAGYSHGKGTWDVGDILEGKYAAKHFDLEEIKSKLIEQGYLKEECAICGHHERRLSDYKMPLILNFKDENPNNFSKDNIRFLCYNCFFLNITDIFNDKDIYKLETHIPVYGTSDAIDFQLDDYQKQRLSELGLYDPPKPEDDGSEFISRL